MAAYKPNKIESALLYQDFATVAPQGLLRHLNASLADTGLSFEPVESSPDDSYSIFTGDGLHVMLSQTRSPLPLDGFASALASPYTHVVFPNAEEIVALHACRMYVTVGSGLPMPDLPNIRELMEMPEADQSQAEFESKLTVCRLLTDALINHNRPMAVHWCQSNQILKPDQFARLAKAPFPVPLFVHPSLFSSQAVVNGTRVVGLRTYGAAHLIGREIVFHEAPVPFAWMYERACNFIEMARASGTIIPHGDSFGASPAEVIRVRHGAPSERDPDGVIELTLERCDEHGFIVDQPVEIEPAQTQDAGEVVLNLNDPVDRAIAERRRELDLSPARPPSSPAAVAPSSDRGFGKRQDTRH